MCLRIPTCINTVLSGSTEKSSLYDYDWQAGTAYGVVIVDFAPKKIAEKIYQTNFQPAQ